jgi:hypothetical protein
MPGPDFRPVELLFWVVLSGPIMLGMLAAALASCAGAEEGVRLPRGRYLVVAAVGTVVGWSCLAWAFALGLPLVGVSCFALLLLPIPAAGVACLAAYVMATVLGGAVNWYRCATCRVWFRSLHPATQCPRCAAEADRAATDQALAEFASRVRDVCGE